MRAPHPPRAPIHDPLRLQRRRRRVEQRELHRRRRREVGQSHAEEPRRHAPTSSQLGEQLARDREQCTVRRERLVHRPTRLARREVGVANADGDGACRQPLAPELGRGSSDQLRELALEQHIIVQVGVEGLVAADAFRDLALRHLALVDSAHASRRAIQHRAHRRVERARQHRALARPRPHEALTRPTAMRSSGRCQGCRRASSWRMNASSSPVGTTCTPVAPVPGFGLARSTASFATSFDVPPPIETERLVAARTASRTRCAISDSAAPP